MTLQDTAGPAATTTPVRRARRTRRAWVLPAVFLLVVCAVLGRGLLTAEEEPSTMLGANASVPGGLARINGVMPYAPTLAPGEAVPDRLTGPVGAGSHRVLVLLEVTAMERGGLEFRADDYAVERLGGGTSPVAWASQEEAFVEQGGRLHAELVFEVPDRALELILEGAGDARLSLGTDHHSGSR